MHELLFLLHEAGQLELSAACAVHRRQLIVRLEHALRMDLEASAAFDPSPYQQETYQFLRGLSSSAHPARRQRRRLPVFNPAFGDAPVSGLSSHRAAIGTKAWRRNEEQLRKSRPR
jgi:hypothetical protein